MTAVLPGLAAAAVSVSEADVRSALGTVVDPELDEPITDVGFVRSVVVRDTGAGSAVEVHLRLPTSFCAPNFAWLMVSDAHEAVFAVQGV
ncbi:MAG TPA: iron-sulfur cluster assembly protein, partial [Geodermatophilus sp.]|nr:iron-sulfur cluster assembly protein [Geodermatophilus sp.]